MSWETRDLADCSQLTFNDFYVTERTGAIRLAWLLLGDASAAEDVTQEAFMAVFERYSTVEPPRAYLRQAIVNGVRSRARSTSRRNLRERLTAAGESVTSPAPGDPLIDVLSELSQKQQTVLVLRYWADMPDEEIAEVLQLRQSSVRSLAHRGLRELKRKLPS